MNQIRAIQALNKKEIENGISPDASWHVDYRDTAFIYFGGLPYELSEGDVITLFSQFGEPVFLKLVRDKETGKSKGFGWLKYEDQRSTDLAVDNLGGAEVGGRLLRVDHARYKARDDEDQEEFKCGWEDMRKRDGQDESDEDTGGEEDKDVARAMLPKERELALLIQNHDDDDPMKEFLIEEKKKEIDEARRRADRKEKKHRHRGDERRHKSRRDDADGDRHERSHRDDRSPDNDRRHDSRRHGERNDSRDRHRRHKDRDEESGGHARRRETKDDWYDDRDRGQTRRRRDRDDSEGGRHRRRRDDDDDDDDSRRRERNSRRHKSRSRSLGR